MTNPPPPPQNLSNLTTAAVRIDLSEIEDKGEIVETHDDRLRRRTLTPLVWYFISANALLDVVIFAFALDERIHPSFGEHIVTEKVLIALITGNTVQVAAMIVAAFRGLFDSKKAKITKAKGKAKPKAKKPDQAAASAR